jgi:hypothetical protein
MRFLWISITCLILFLIVFISLLPKTIVLPKTIPQKRKSGVCSSTCSSKHLEPVNDPDFNVREAIKQTLLLEQHLAEKSKYCKSCSVKHFLLIESLLTEGVWMACNRCKEYPKLEESVDFIKKLFNEWHSNMEDDKTRLNALSKLRDWRRVMVDLYYFKDGKSDSHS